MKISQLASELDQILKAKGDLDCTISIALPDEMLAALKANGQHFAVATPLFCVVEGNATPPPDNKPCTKEEVMIRDWPY